MSIRVKCTNPACGKEFKLKDELAGKVVRCDACKQAFQVPPVSPEQGTAEASAPRPGAPVADASPPEPPDPLIDQKLGHYRVLERVGAGAMSTVYKAHDLRLDKIVALKVMSPEMMSHGREFVQRFIQEARTAAKVEHATVLPVYFIGVEGEHLFIAMQYADGGTLGDKLKREGRLDPQQAVRVLESVALALWAAHARKIVHRDIKPSNIMLMTDGRVMVSDFGIAKMGDSPTDRTAAGQILGTPAYMAPEHGKGLEVDGRTDLYAAGVMFYRMVTGELPFKGQTPLETVRMHVSAPVPDPRALAPDLDERICAIIMRLMAKRPEDRYQNAAGLVQDLTAVLTAPGAEGQTPSEVQAGEAGPSRTRSVLSFVAQVAVILLVLGGAVTYYFVSQEQPEGEQAAIAPAPAETGKGLAAPEEKGTAPPPSGPQTSAVAAAPAPKAASPVAPPGVPPASPSAAPPPAPTAGVAPGPEKAPAPAPKSEAPPVGPAAEGAAKPAPPPAVQPAPKPGPTEAAPVPPPPSFDPLAYQEDVKAANERIDAGDYAGSRSRVNLLKEKYPDLAATKLSNIDRIVALRKSCMERLNSGVVKVTMADVSKRFAFAGEIQKADEAGLTAAIKKGWEGLTKGETTSFYRKASDPKSAQDKVAIAAFLMEGSAGEQEHEQALDLLGEAIGLKSAAGPDEKLDVSACVKYLETLKAVRKASAQAATPREAEKAKPKEEPAEAAKPAVKSLDDVYVTTAATGDKIPHPLCKKTQRIISLGKRVDIPDGMVYVPAGPFIMGDDRDPMASPAHRMEVEAFLIDKYEVTNAQYMEFVKATQHSMPEYIKENTGEIPKERENCPVTDVSWEDATAYCEWCGKRLPTEAEWEKAASWDPRLKRKLKYSWGNEEDTDPKHPLANTALRWGWKPGMRRGEWWDSLAESEKGKELLRLGGATLPVGSFRKTASPYGCYDMIGNAAEWVEDWLDKYPGNTHPPERLDSRLGQQCRVVRGGDWSSLHTECASRTAFSPRTHKTDTGFRCAKTP